MDGDYRLYIKGADSEIMRRLDSEHSQPYLAATQNMLDQFSTIGLRTLVFATRTLTKLEYENAVNSYKDACSSSDKKILLKELADTLEQKLVLLGCTAIEDHLQEEVAESIKRFQDANIKVWMITGDKLETAINIAMTAGIAKSDARIFRFTGGSEHEFTKYVEILKREIQDTPRHISKTIVLDTYRNSRIILLTIDFIFKKEILNTSEFNSALKIFKQLLLDVDSVVCARTIPMFKAELVKLVRKTGKCVLAIGDGANDVNMLTVFLYLIIGCECWCWITR